MFVAGGLGYGVNTNMKARGTMVMMYGGGTVAEDGSVILKNGADGSST